MTEKKYVGIRLPADIYKNVHGVAEETDIPIAVLCRSAVVQMYGAQSFPGGVA